MSCHIGYIGVQCIYFRGTNGLVPGVLKGFKEVFLLKFTGGYAFLDIFVVIDNALSEKMNVGKVTSCQFREKGIAADADFKGAYIGSIHRNDLNLYVPLIGSLYKGVLEIVSSLLVDGFIVISAP